MEERARPVARVEPELSAGLHGRPTAEPGLTYRLLRAPIVPLILGGNHEPYLGRRIAMRALPALDPLELAGLEPAAPLPAPDSREERAAIHRLTRTLADRVAAAVEEVHELAEPAPGTPKRGLFLTKLFR